MKRVRQLVSTCLIMVMVFSCMGMITNAAGSSKKKTMTASEETLSEGSDDEAVVTRAEWIQQLVATFGMTVEEDNYPDNYFSDLTGEEEYYRDILVAVEFGVIDLEAGLPFEPDDPTTREFAAHTLNFCLGFQLEEDVIFEFSEAEAVTYPEDIQVAINRGWFVLSDSDFLPEQAITEEEKTTMLADAATILENSVIDENYDSTFTFSDEVTVIPESTLTQLNEDGTVLVCNPETAIEEENIFAIYVDGLPMVFQADKVTVSGTNYTINVTKLDVNDYLLSADAEGTMTGNLEDFEVAEGLEAIYILEDGTEVANARAAGAKKIKSIYFDKRLKGYSVHIEVTDMVLNWRAKGSSKKTVDVSAVVTGDAYCSISLPFGVSASDFGDTLVLGTYPIGPFGSVTVTADLSIDGSVSVAYGAKFSTGIEYTYSGGFRIPSEFYKTYFSLTVEANLRAGITARAGIWEIPMLDASCYATIGMQTNFTSYYRGNDANPKLCIHTDCWLYAKVGASASIGVKQWDSLNESWSGEIIIWDRNHNPIRSVTHFEDGTLVSKCSYGDFNCSYYSGAGSRYANGGVSAMANVPKYTYTVDEDGNATITGYSGSGGAVSIPSTIDGYTVTAIGNNAFKEKISITSITMPATVTSIGTYAFSGCTGLKSVMLPDGITVIERGTFENCTSLVSINIPDTVEIIENYAFKNSGLQKLEFPEAVVKLGNGILINTEGVKEIYIPKGVTYMGSYSSGYSGALGGSYIEKVTFEDGITTLPAYACSDMEYLKEVIIPETVTKIEMGAFRESKNIEQIELPKYLTKIGDDAFRETGIVELELPKTITELGQSILAETVGVKEIYIPKSVTDMGSYSSGYSGALGGSYIEKVTFEDGITTLPAYACSDMEYLKEVIIPETVTKIEVGAFRESKNIEQIELPDNLTYIADSVFRECEALNEITIPNKVTKIGSNAFEDTGLVEIKLPDSLIELGNGILTNVEGVKEIYIPKGVTYMGCFLTRYSGALGGSYVEKVTFEEGMTTIPSYACADMEYLKEVNFPETVTKIDARVFWESTNIEQIVLPKNLSRIENEVFRGCKMLKTICFPETVVYMGTGMFYGCTSLEEITLPPMVMTIQSSTFRDCTSLKMINWSDSITTIKESVFQNCDALETVEVPSTVTTIGNNVFYDCDALTKITIPDSVSSFGTKMFYDCDALTDVTLGTGITTIPTSTFEHCDVLESIKLPYRTASIGATAFKDCVKFKSITIPRATTTIDSTAFSYPAQMTIYGVAGTYAETFANENNITFVNQEVNATEVTLNNSTLELNKGKTATLIMNVTPADFTDEVAWKSTDTAVATISDAGLVTAKGVGTATIKVTVGNVSASCKVTVVQPVTGISLNKTSLTLEALDTYQLKATVSPTTANNQSITWSSSDEAIASVDENGLVTTHKKGTATITVEAQDGSGIKKTCTVTVSNNGVIAKTIDELESPHNYANSCTDFWVYTQEGADNLAVTFDSQTMIEEDFDFLYIYDKDGNEIGEYTGAELAGATINVPGDTVKIQFKSDSSGNEWGFKVTKIEAAQAPEVEKQEQTITGTTSYTKTEGDASFTLNAKTSGDGILSYESDDTDVVKVSNKGVVTIVGTGSAVITVTASETDLYKAATFEITVTVNEEVCKHEELEIWDAEEATCTSEGYTGDKYCSDCGILIEQGKIIEATDHNYEEVIVPATVDEDGAIMEICANCDDVASEETIPAIDTVSLNKTKLVYNAKTQSVTVTVKDTDGNTIPAKYYTKTNTSKKSVGVYTVTVTFKGNYDGIVKLKYSIVPKAPASLKAELYQYGNKVKLTWEKATGATGYRISFKKPGSSSYTYLTSTTKLTYTKGSLLQNKKYTFKVTPYYKPSGSSTQYYSTASTAYKTKAITTATKGKQLVKVSKPTVAKSGTKVKVTWKNVANETGYQISKSTSSTGTNIVSTYKTTTGKSKTIAATKGTKYYYKVRAYRIANGRYIYGDWSAVRAYTRK